MSESERRRADFRRRAMRWIGLLGLVATASAWPVVAQVPCDDDATVPGEIVFELSPGAPVEDAVARYGLSLRDGIPQWNTWLAGVTVGRGEDPAIAVEAVLDAMHDDDQVERAEASRLLESPEGVQLSIPDIDNQVSSEDYGDQPAFAQDVTFYLFRDDAPAIDGGSSYGFGSPARRRVPGATDCPIVP